MMKTG